MFPHRPNFNPPSSIPVFNQNNIHNKNLNLPPDFIQKIVAQRRNIDTIHGFRPQLLYDNNDQTNNTSQNSFNTGSRIQPQVQTQIDNWNNQMINSRPNPFNTIHTNNLSTRKNINVIFSLEKFDRNYLIRNEDYQESSSLSFQTSQFFQLSDMSKLHHTLVVNLQNWSGKQINTLHFNSTNVEQIDLVQWPEET